jgi:hypothetical protein
MTRINQVVLLILTLFATSRVSAGEHYALLVGVRQYDPAQLTALRYTENDVNQMAQVLMSTGYGAENLVLMTQSVGAADYQRLPTARQIRKQLTLLTSEVAEDDTLLLAFSGHGVQFKNENNIYFCPMDADLSDRSSLISLTDVYALLGDRKKCRARTKVLIVDACRNDPQTNLSRSKGIELEPVGINKVIESPGGVAAFFSCSRGQKSYEHPERQNGIFAEFVIDALAGAGDLDRDGEVSLAELEQFTVKQTQRFARTRLGESQVPERRGTIRGATTLSILPKVFYVYDAHAAAGNRFYEAFELRPEYLGKKAEGHVILATKFVIEQRSRVTDGQEVTYTVQVPAQEEIISSFHPAITTFPPVGYQESPK